MTVTLQILWLFISAIPVSCVAWTVTHEEIFREPRDFCIDRVHKGKTLWERKFFYLFTCEYCFSHYVTIGYLILTNYRLMFSDWRGLVIAGFSIIWVANTYMSLFALLRQGIVKEKAEIKVLENTANNAAQQ